MFSARTQRKGMKTMSSKWEHCKLSYAEHTRTHANKERKLRGDLSVVTLQIVLEKEKEKEKKKETKTCGVFLDSACGCCKNRIFFSNSALNTMMWFLSLPYLVKASLSDFNLAIDTASNLIRWLLSSSLLCLSSIGLYYIPPPPAGPIPNVYLRFLLMHLPTVFMQSAVLLDSVVWNVKRPFTNILYTHFSQ